MAEYIKRGYAVDAALNVYYDTPDIDLSGEKFEAAILKIPVADVAPVRHGRWEMNSDRPDNIICTNCDVGFDVWKHEAKDFNYCPNCGAIMDLEEAKNAKQP